MYHCGTAPAFVHIANGMYGAIVVEPREPAHADRQYVLVASEWYLNIPGDKAAAGLDTVKADQMTPDWVTWNGYARQYKEHPLTAAARPDGALLGRRRRPLAQHRVPRRRHGARRAWLNADLVDAPQHEIQTAVVPAGGGGVFDVRIAKPGIYPFVSHSFASVAMGEVGLLKVGHVAGTMSH